MMLPFIKFKDLCQREIKNKNGKQDLSWLDQLCQVEKSWIAAFTSSAAVSLNFRKCESKGAKIHRKHLGTGITRFGGW